MVSLGKGRRKGTTGQGGTGPLNILTGGLCPCNLEP